MQLSQLLRRLVRWQTHNSMSFEDISSLILQVATNCLGEAVSYTAAGHAAVSIKAIYDGIYEDVDPNTGAIIVSKTPTIGVKDSDLPAGPSKGDLCTVRSVNYKVVKVEPDGQGGSKLILHKA